MFAAVSGRRLHDSFDAKYDEWAQKYAEAGYQVIAEERLQAMKDGLTSAMQQ
nr:hypothetical protein [uncultured Acetatifactor sp.]